MHVDEGDGGSNFSGRRAIARRAWLVVSVALAVSFAGCSRAATEAQSRLAPPAASLSYISAWGVKGTGPGQMSDPVDIATDSVGDAYIVDAESHFIEKFDRRGTPLLAFEEDLKHPQAITVDSGGAIYVTDSGRASATVFLPSGDRYREIRLRTRTSEEDPLDVAVEDDGTIHILDADADKLFSYSPQFRLLRTWVPIADGPSPKVRAKAVANGFDGFLYVADPEQNRVVRFTGDGKFFAALNPNSDGAMRKLSDRIAVSRGYIFAMDVDGRMLHVFSTDGRPVLDADLATELGQGKRLAPALAVSPHKELLVLDTPETRVLRYRIDF